jgi:hypothetical protein
MDLEGIPMDREKRVLERRKTCGEILDEKRNLHSGQIVG